MSNNNLQGSSKDVSADVIIVGAGFGGCYALHKIRELGLSGKIIDASGDYGGVWYHNRYPGVRVDSDSPSYQFTLPKLWEDFNFTERYPTGAEILRYFDNMAKVLDLRKDTIFSTRVTEVTYDSASRTWNLLTNVGWSAKGKYVILATGTSNKVYVPDYPGWKDFQGKSVWPAAWPKDLDIHGKKIAVIGQGSSGVQIVQEACRPELNNKVSVFIRTVPFTMPLRNRAISYEESEQDKIHYEALFDQSKFRNFSTHPFNQPVGSWYNSNEEERMATYERLFRRGSFWALSGGFYDQLRHDETSDHFYQYWRKRVHERMTDPVKRELMAPPMAWMPLVGKRPVLERDYYESIDQPHVELVHLKKTPITHFTSDGIVTSDGVTHEADIVVFATGYDAVTGSLYDMNVHDRDGVKLQDKWKDGIRTYLGMTTDKLPNCFFLYGPQAPSSFTNGPLFIEMQVDWVADTLKKALEEEVDVLEPSSEAVDAYVQDVWRFYKGSAFEASESWWVGSNIPGKKKEPLLWCGGVPSWWNNCKDGLKDWSHYVTAK
ncbi:hypothetical protein diail_2914 [Diaporthe ilicicola]|nr:hypothetical protein diail_2914 [Diaporthe ilicicola]